MYIKFINDDFFVFLNINLFIYSSFIELLKQQVYNRDIY